MEENNKPIEEQENENATISNDELKDIIEEQMSNLRSQSMILGFRVACQSILNKIVAFERTPGNKSNNDHKRLIKDIKKFVEQGLARKADGNDAVEATEPETVQN